MYTPKKSKPIEDVETFLKSVRQEENLKKSRSWANKEASDLNKLAGSKRFYTDIYMGLDGKEYALFDRVTGKSYVYGAIATSLALMGLRAELKSKKSGVDAISRASSGGRGGGRSSIRHNDSDFNDEYKDSDIEHYGVLGMKWGVRKDPDKAYKKANEKLDRLDKKVAEAASKITKAEAKSVERQRKADTSVLFRKHKSRRAETAIRKSEAARHEYIKSFAKAERWYKQMENAFRDTSVNSIDSHYIELGKKYANIKIADLMANVQTSAATKQLIKYYRDMGR